MPGQPKHLVQELNVSTVQSCIMPGQHEQSVLEFNDGTVYGQNSSIPIVPCTQSLNPLPQTCSFVTEKENLLF